MKLYFYLSNSIFYEIKIIFFISIILKIGYQKNNLKKYYLDINKNYEKLNENLNLSFFKSIKKESKINIAIYGYCIKNGGRARITSLLVNYFHKINIFNIILFTRTNIEKEEYFIPNNIKRFTIKNHLFKIINKNKINILIYELDDIKEITKLNNYLNINVIFYQHSSSFDWLYKNYTKFKLIYKAFSLSKYIISIVPFDSDYLFKKWGINSILMTNFITHEFNYVSPSDLSTKTILLIGRGKDTKKRFHIGIEAMEYINNEIPGSELIIISNLTGIEHLTKLVNNLGLGNSIKFNGYSSSPDLFFKNVSLNIFPSISEAFPMVLSEAKIYGIPCILLGLDYIYIAKNGTIIIYDDLPESLAKESINIIINKEFRKKLGKEARNSMKQFNNEILLIKWIKLILSIYNDEFFYIKLREENHLMTQNDDINILNNQLNLLKMRNEIFKNITQKEFENFKYMEIIQ